MSNEHVSVGLIEDYALGDALAAIYYTEPVTTYDADIIFLASDKMLREQLMTQAKIDRPLLDDILRRYNLRLPKP